MYVDHIGIYKRSYNLEWREYILMFTQQEIFFLIFCSFLLFDYISHCYFFPTEYVDNDGTCFDCLYQYQSCARHERLARSCVCCFYVAALHNDIVVNPPSDKNVYEEVCLDEL